MKRFLNFITSASHSRTVGVLAVLILLAAVPLTVMIAQRQQEIRQQAASAIQINFRACLNGQWTLNDCSPNDTITVDKDTPVNLTWTVFGEDVCTADWNGNNVIQGNGSFLVTATVSKSYNIKCTNSGGEASKGVTVNVNGSGGGGGGGGFPPLPPVTSCPNYTDGPCSQIGAKKCSGTTGYWVCTSIKFNAGNSLDCWGPQALACPLGQTCSGAGSCGGAGGTTEETLLVKCAKQYSQYCKADGTSCNWGPVQGKPECVATIKGYQTCLGVNDESATNVANSVCSSGANACGTSRCDDQYCKGTCPCDYSSVAGTPACAEAVRKRWGGCLGHPENVVKATIDRVCTGGGGTGGGTGAKVNLTLGLNGLGSTGDNTTPTDSRGSNKDPKRKTRQATVELFETCSSTQPKATKTGSLAYNSTSGRFEGNVDLNDITAGTYAIKVKSPSYLRRCIAGKSIASGQAVEVAANLVSGDIQNDNRLTVLDYNILAGCYSDRSPAKSCDADKKNASDLTDDGNVNGFDVILFQRDFFVQQGE